MRKVAFPRIAACLLAAVVQSFASAAPAAELAPDAPRTYVVQSGDTLWDIAGRFLQEPWRWPEIWEASGDRGDPDRIYPGDVLQLTTVDGRPRLTLARGSSARSGRGIRVERLTPQVRSSELRQPIPTIPIATISPFLTQPYVADSDEIERASYVVGFPDEHLVAGVNDSIYVRRLAPGTGSEFQVLRPGDELRDPDSNEVLGYQALFVANAVLERAGDPAKLAVVRMEREVSIGDRVIPAARERPLADFFPHPAPAGTRGRIISVLNGVTQVGQYDVVVLNRGAHDRIEPGHVFEVFVGGNHERDQVASGGFDSRWTKESPLTTEFWFGADYVRKGWRRDEPSPNEPLPPHADFRRQNSRYVKPLERSGILMVFRTFDRVSFAVLLRAGRSIHVGDWVAPPPA